MTNPDRPQPSATHTGSDQAQPRAFVVADLFGGAAEIHIIHAGQQYRMRLTRNGRLILTK